MSNNESTQIERASVLRDKTYDLCSEATEWDEATSWSHWNGAFVALVSVLAAGGQVPESVLSEYEDYIKEFASDDDDEETA